VRLTILLCVTAILGCGEPPGRQADPEDRGMSRVFPRATGEIEQTSQPLIIAGPPCPASQVGTTEAQQALDRVNYIRSFYNFGCASDRPASQLAALDHSRYIADSQRRAEDDGDHSCEGPPSTARSTATAPISAPSTSSIG
jgi:hypothetical protein